jgi:hypothetical protein
VISYIVHLYMQETHMVMFVFAKYISLGFGGFHSA